MSTDFGCSGWSVYPSALYGTQTPCYSIPAVPLVAPTGLQARAARILPRAASTSLITTQLFTLRYPLAHSGQSLSTGAKASIAIGVVLGIVLLAVLLFFFIRRYRAIRAKQLDDRSTVFSGSRFMGTTDHYDRRISAFSAPSGYYPQSEPPVIELPSPTAAMEERRPLAENQLWFPPSGRPVSPGQQQHVDGESQQPMHAEPNELVGDVNLHAHHPAFAAATGAPAPEHVEERGSVTPSGIVSPT